MRALLVRTSFRLQRYRVADRGELERWAAPGLIKSQGRSRGLIRYPGTVVDGMMPRTFSALSLKIDCDASGVMSSLSKSAIQRST